MACIPIQEGNRICGWLCGAPDYWTYLCFEHTTYMVTFGKFGPIFYRIECGREIEVDFTFSDYDVVSNKFLWDIWEEWHEGREK